MPMCNLHRRSKIEEEEEENQEEPQKGMFWVDGNGQAAMNIPDKGGGGDTKRPQKLNVSGKGQQQPRLSRL
jgi:hypothetical protein